MTTHEPRAPRAPTSLRVALGALLLAAPSAARAQRPASHAATEHPSTAAPPAAHASTAHASTAHASTAHASTAHAPAAVAHGPRTPHATAAVEAPRPSARARSHTSGGHAAERARPEQSPEPDDSPPVVEVATGGEHVCERHADGRVACRNLASGAEGDVHGLRDVVQLAMGAELLCARAANGEVRCLTDRELAAQLAPHEGPARAHPRTADVPGISGATQVVVGDRHACALLGDGTVRCWGSNERGAAGASEHTRTVTAPNAVAGLTGVVELAAGGDRTCARSNAGHVSCWGERPVIGGTGGRAIEWSPERVARLRGAAQLAVGRGLACARLTDGHVRCWGEGPLGNGSPNPSPTPVAARGLTHVVEVVVGRAHACARTDRGVVSCWGANDREQVSRHGRPLVVTVARAVPAARGATQLAASDDRTCVRRGRGTVACWGAVDRQDTATQD